MRRAGARVRKPSHFFDIHSPKDLFDLLKTIAHSYSSSRAKRTEDLLLLVFGLTHLREWIAPGYDPKHEPTTPEERFHQSIFDLEEFKILQGLCNRSKHMNASSAVMGTLYESKIDDWPDVDSVKNFDQGVPTEFSVDNRDVRDVIDSVIKFYEIRWFQSNTPA